MFFLWPLQHIWFSCLGSAEVLSHLPTSEVTEGLMHLCEPLVQPLSQVCITESPMSLKDHCCCTLQIIFNNVSKLFACKTEFPCLIFLKDLVTGIIIIGILCRFFWQE